MASGAWCLQYYIVSAIGFGPCGMWSRKVIKSLTRVGRFLAVVVVIGLMAKAEVHAESNTCARLFTYEAQWETLMEASRAMLLANINGAITPAKPGAGSLTTNDISDIYNRNSDTSHARILKDILKIPFDGKSPMPSVKSILDSYNLHMDRLVKDGLIKAEDVLRPAFVFKRKDGVYQILKYGETIPRNAEFIGDVLPTFTFDHAVSKGFFPIGNETITNTRVSSWEHDLSHLTSFIENPHYMAQIKRQAEQDSKRMLNVYATKAKRKYFLGESLVLVRPERKVELFNLLPMTTEMKKNPNAFSFSNIIYQVAKLDQQQLIHIANTISYRYERYFQNLGGASRDPLSTVGIHIHTPLRVFIDDAKRMDVTKESTVKTFAKMQYALMRFSEVSLEEWFASADNAQIDKNSNVGKVFEEQRVWIEQSFIYNSFTSSSAF